MKHLILVSLLFSMAVTSNSQSTSNTAAIQLATFKGNDNLYSLKDYFDEVNIYGSVLFKRFQNGIVKVYLVDHDLTNFSFNNANSIKKAVRRNKKFSDAFIVEKVPGHEGYTLFNKTETGIVFNSSKDKVKSEQLIAKNQPIESYEKIDIEYNNSEYFTIHIGCFAKTSKEDILDKLGLHPFEYKHKLFPALESNSKCTRFNFMYFDTEAEAKQMIAEIRKNVGFTDLTKGLKPKYYGPDPLVSGMTLKK